MSWNQYWEKRVNKVKENSPLADVLEHYDIPLRRKDTEVQFPCPLHGDGKDKRYSGRFYPDTNSTYCWACKKARDPIEWVRDYEYRRKGNSLEFHEALQQLEQWFDISPPPPPEDVEESDEQQEKATPEPLLALQRMGEGEDETIRTNDAVVERIEEADEKLAKIIRDCRENTDLADPLLKLGFLLDNIRFDYVQGRAEKEKAQGIVEKVESKLQSIKERLYSG